MTTYQRLLEREEEQSDLHGQPFVSYKIGRGGYYGMTAEQAVEFLGIPKKHVNNLPDNVGFSLQDMGGGINLPRKLSVKTMEEHGIPTTQALKLRTFVNACEKRYKELNQGDDFIQ